MEVMSIMQSLHVRHVITHITLLFTKSYLHGTNDDHKILSPFTYKTICFFIVLHNIIKKI